MNNEEIKNINRTHFIEQIIEEDLSTGKIQNIHTRFPPEPNGFLHIGHAKSICLNFGMANKFNGLCNLRFDDTNPLKEDTIYVDSIMDDIRWLGFDWEDRLFFASDYFDQFYNCALHLIKKNKAYICDLNAEEIRHHRGTLTSPGKESPFRNRSIDENLELFEQMKKGEFTNGEKVLRAKIDMNSPNLNMRDPVIYRISHARHHRTKDLWCIYPMYDFAHPLSDAFEKITHSLCTLEFEDHRPLYDWFIDNSGVDFKPRQIEFARLNISNTVLSKRLLKKMVDEECVNGWDDPRMPTISGLRNRGYTPSSIRHFCELIGVAKSNSTVEKELLEHCIREELNKTAPRIMAVLDPLKIIITNFPENETEWLEAENNPEDPSSGKRMMPFTKELYIEKNDFMEIPVKKFFRLSPGKEVRLKNAFIIQCNEIVKDDTTGEILELHCTFDPLSKSSNDTSGKKVKGTLHWVSAHHNLPIEVNFFDHLTIDNPPAIEETNDNDSSVTTFNPCSLKAIKKGVIEKNIEKTLHIKHFQFLRHGYFILSSLERENLEHLLFNHIVSLKDSWAKIQKKTNQQ